jgi:predicted NodU family carbamoyl transferase
MFSGVPKLELSHHLAHAWAAAGTAPFDEGLVLVMDGMYKAMVERATKYIGI